MSTTARHSYNCMVYAETMNKCSCELTPLRVMKTKLETENALLREENEYLKHKLKKNESATKDAPDTHF